MQTLNKNQSELFLPLSLDFNLKSMQHTSYSLLVHASIFVFAYFFFTINPPHVNVTAGNNNIEFEFTAATPIASSPSLHAQRTATKNTHQKASSSDQGALSEAKPNYLKNAPPVYPEFSRFHHQEGIVLLLADITPEGLVKSLVLTKSSGFPLLDEAAIRAVQQWQFQPAQSGKTPIAASVTVPVRFRIEKI